MDLRLLCVGSSEVDAAAGEVGKRATGTKYYHDRMKLAVGAKSQLNQLISKYKLSTIEATKLKICTIQILGSRIFYMCYDIYGPLKTYLLYHLPTNQEQRRSSPYFGWLEKECMFLKKRVASNSPLHLKHSYQQWNALLPL